MILNAIIVDDEHRAVEILQRYIREASNIILVKTFRDPVEAVSFVRLNAVDVIFLDINMPTLSGLDFSKIVSGKSNIIFTTAYPEYALQGFELNAIDYLVKPISFERFLQALDKVLKVKIPGSTPSENGTLFFKSGNKIFRIPTEDILLFEKQGNYFSAKIRGGKNISIRMNFNELTSYLPADRFHRVHKSFIVAHRHISCIEAEMIIIEDHRIPIGLHYRPVLEKILPASFFKKKNIN